MILDVALSDNMVSMASNIFWQIRAKYSPEQYCIIKGNDYLIAIYSRAAAVPTMAEELEHVYFLIESIGFPLTCIILIKANFQFISYTYTLGLNDFHNTIFIAHL